MSQVRANGLQYRRDLNVFLWSQCIYGFKVCEAYILWGKTWWGTKPTEQHEQDTKKAYFQIYQWSNYFPLCLHHQKAAQSNPSDILELWLTDMD